MRLKRRRRTGRPRYRHKRRRFGPPLWMPLLLAAALSWLWLEGGIMRPIAANGAVVDVVDGDSLWIGDTEIRIAGYDAPEWAQWCETGAGIPWPCGLQARRRLATLARAGGLECSPAGTDRYGRTLAHCRTGEGDVGAAMVREGLGLRTGQMPFRYQAEENEARAHARGVWQGRFQHPADYRNGG